MRQQNSSAFSGGALYRETVRQAAFGERKYIRRLDGRGHFAHLQLHLQPVPGLPCTVVKAKTLQIPDDCYQAARMALHKKFEEGSTWQYPMHGVHVALTGGTYLAPYASPEAFACAARMAFDEALKRAIPLLIEPWVVALLKVEDHALDRVLCELIRILGMITLSLSRRDHFEISVEVPQRMLPLLRTRFGLRRIETRALPSERQYREHTGLAVIGADASGLEDWT